MIGREYDMAAKAQVIMAAIASDDLQITHVWSERTKIAEDNAEAWVLKIRTSGNHNLVFWMEGVNIHILMELVDSDGHRLIGDHNRIDAHGLLPVQIKLDLEKIVREAHTHMCAVE